VSGAGVDGRPRGVADGSNTAPIGGTSLDKWECVLCGYIYDPEVGDDTQDILPGTKWEDLPDDWVCPICGAGKEDFEKVEA